MKRSPSSACRRRRGAPRSCHGLTSKIPTSRLPATILRSSGVWPWTSALGLSTRRCSAGSTKELPSSKESVSDCDPWRLAVRSANSGALSFGHTGKLATAGLGASLRCRLYGTICVFHYGPVQAGAPRGAAGSTYLMSDAIALAETTLDEGPSSTRSAARSPICACP